MKSSHVPHTSPDQIHATFMPNATQAVSRFPLGLSWCTDSHQFWRRLYIFDTSSDGSLSLVSLIHNWTRLAGPFPQRSPPRLLTDAAWGVLESAPASRLRGAKPSSPVQLRTLYIKVRSWRTICYIYAIPKAGSEVVISFFNRANPFCRVCLFCNFVRNKIYVLEVEMLELVLLASYLHFLWFRL